MTFRHYDTKLHPNFTRLYHRYGVAHHHHGEIEELPSILISYRELEAVHLRHNPGYVDDGDIDYVEHAWFLSHFSAVAYRLSHMEGSGAETRSFYRFYFPDDETAMTARLMV